MEGTGCPFREQRLVRYPGYPLPPTIESCPTCGRCQVNLVDIATKVEKAVAHMRSPIKIAVMGCRVNGIQEAKDADIGVACGKGRGAIFREGKIIKTVSEKDIINKLLSMIPHIEAKTESIKEQGYYCWYRPDRLCLHPINESFTCFAKIDDKVYNKVRRSCEYRGCT